jgi:hypothetical protein
MLDLVAFRAAIQEALDHAATLKGPYARQITTAIIRKLAARIK